MKHILLCLCYLSALVMTPFTVSARQAPEACLVDIQRALDTRDLSLFEQRVALDALVEQGINLLAKRLQQAGEQGSQLPPALVLMVYSLQNEALAPSVRAMLTQELTSFVRSGIATGYLNGSPKKNIQQEGILARFIPDISTGKKTLRLGRKTAQTADNGYIILPAVLHDAGNGRSYPLQLALRPTHDSWQVKEIRNMPEILHLLEEERHEMVQEY